MKENYPCENAEVDKIVEVIATHNVTERRDVAMWE